MLLGGLGVGAIAMGAAKLVGSMVAWEIGTRALEYGIEEYNKSDDNSNNNTTVTGDSTGLDYTQRTIEDDNTQSNSNYGIGAGLATIGMIGGAAAVGKYSDKIKNAFTSNKAVSRAVYNVEGFPTKQSHIDWFKRKYKNKMLPVRINPSAPAARGMLGKVGSVLKKTIWPKSKIGRAMSIFTGVSLLLSAYNKATDRAPSENLSKENMNKQLQDFAMSKQYKDLVEQKLGINYMTKIEHDMGKKISQLLETPDVNEKDMDKLLSTSESAIHNKWMDVIINTSVMLSGKGAAGYERSNQELDILKKAQTELESQTEIIRGNESEERKNKARESIMNIKDKVFGLGNRNAEVMEAIKTAQNYMAYTINLRKLAMAGMSSKTDSGEPKINASSIAILRDLLLEGEDVTGISEEESVKGLGKIAKFLQSTIPDEDGVLGGGTKMNILEAFKARGNQ